MARIPTEATNGETINTQNEIKTLAKIRWMENWYDSATIIVKEKQTKPSVPVQIYIARYHVTMPEYYIGIWKRKCCNKHGYILDLPSIDADI